MKHINNSPLRAAWAHEKAKLKEKMQQVMQAAGLKTVVQFYDLINGNRKTPLTEEQQKKVAEIFGKPVKTLFPPQDYFE
jgi:hypothetical protein